MSEPELPGRLLIAWDHAASGVWTIRPPSGRTAAYELDADLKGRIQAWNLRGERLDGGVGPFPPEFWDHARALAAAVQPPRSWGR